MKKRTFLLLEILIALSLVMLCAVPLVKQPLYLYRNEMKTLVEMERERLADWTFTEIKEILLKNEIPWEKIPENGAQTAPFPLPPFSIFIPGWQPKTIERSFTLTLSKEKIAQNQTLYREIRIKVFLDEKKYEFSLPIRKLRTHSDPFLEQNKKTS